MPAPSSTHRPPRDVTYIHGPQASGKTRLARELLTHSVPGTMIHDDFCGARLPRGASIIVCSQDQPKPAWAGAITTLISLEVESHTERGCIYSSTYSSPAPIRP